MFSRFSSIVVYKMEGLHFTIWLVFRVLRSCTEIENEQISLQLRAILFDWMVNPPPAGHQCFLFYRKKPHQELNAKMNF